MSLWKAGFITPQKQKRPFRRRPGRRKGRCAGASSAIGGARTITSASGERSAEHVISAEAAQLCGPLPGQASSWPLVHSSVVTGNKPLSKLTSPLPEREQIFKILSFSFHWKRSPESAASAGGGFVRCRHLEKWLIEKTVALVDMDCFLFVYVQVEQQQNPHLRTKTCAVVRYKSWKSGGVIAVRCEACVLGLTRNMWADDAKKLCPDHLLSRVRASCGKS